MRKKGRATAISSQALVSAGLLTWSLGLHAQSSENNSRALVRVHGSVVNAVTHTPIPRALVMSADQRMAVMTDDKGRFEFDVNLAAANSPQLGVSGPVETPYIVARKPGYLAPVLPTELPLDDLAALKADLRLQLMPEASISGSAVGVADEIPTGLNVQLLHRQLQNGLATWTQFQNQQVDKRGRFHFGGLVPGEYRLVTAEWVDQLAPSGVDTSKPVAGYPPQFYPSGSSGATAAFLHLAGGQNAVADLNLRGAKYYPVDVPIARESPAKAVQVQVASENGPGYTLGFNTKSRKVEGMLPDGTYHLTVIDVDAGEDASPRAFPEIHAGTGNLTVAGKSAHGAAIALLPAATIAVNVREDFGGPDPTANTGGHPVTDGPGAVASRLGAADAIDPGGPSLPRSVEVFLGPQNTVADGNFSNFGFFPAMQQDPNTGELKFSGVPPGRYHVQINARRGYVASATANGVDLLSDPLVVGSGAESSAISIILRDDSGTIAGTVIGDPGRSRMAALNYVIIAFPFSDGPAAQPVFASAQPDGKFIMENVVPGRYLVLAGVGRPPLLEYRNKDAMKAHESQGSIADVSAGETVTTSVKPLRGEPDYGGETDDEVDD